MRNIILLFVASLFCFSCSDDDSAPSGVVPNQDYINVTFDGVEIEFLKDSLDKQSGRVLRYGDMFILLAGSAYNPSAEQSMSFALTFDKNGNFIHAGQSYNEEHVTGFDSYSNYVNYPEHYFVLEGMLIDEVNMKVKFTFSGDLFHDDQNMDSESKHISGEVEVSYELGIGQANVFFTNWGVEQYCRAIKDGEPWNAYFEPQPSAFTNSGPDKVEIHFSADATPGSYGFTAASTDNYVRYSKFNTATLMYDHYETSGVVAHSYKEFMGGVKYNFIGSFSFTAVNPNDPTDVVEMNSGEFRSVQYF